MCKSCLKFSEFAFVLAAFTNRHIPANNPVSAYLAGNYIPLACLFIKDARCGRNISKGQLKFAATATAKRASENLKIGYKTALVTLHLELTGVNVQIHSLAVTVVFYSYTKSERRVG